MLLPAPKMNFKDVKRTMQELKCCTPFHPCFVFPNVHVWVKRNRCRMWSDLRIGTIGVSLKNLLSRSGYNQEFIQYFRGDSWNKTFPDSAMIWARKNVDGIIPIIKVSNNRDRGCIGGPNRKMITFNSIFLNRRVCT